MKRAGLRLASRRLSCGGAKRRGRTRSSTSLTTTSTSVTPGAMGDVRRLPADLRLHLERRFRRLQGRGHRAGSRRPRRTPASATATMRRTGMRATRATRHWVHDSPYRESGTDGSGFPVIGPSSPSGCPVSLQCSRFRVRRTR